MRPPRCPPRARSLPSRSRRPRSDRRSRARALGAVAAVLALLLATPAAQAQVPVPALPHPSDRLVHHPLTIESELRAIAALNPDFAEVRTFGGSGLVFPLWLIDIHAPDADLDEVLVYYLDGAHHGNEQLGMEALLLWLHELMAWSTTEEGAARLAEVRVVAAPMINPVGVAKDARSNLNSVDLNRNYPYHWGLYGTSDQPTSPNYRGPSPASEPETQANVALMTELHPEVYLSMHTGSHDIVLPWRAEEDGAYPDWAVYEAFLAGIEEVSGLAYRDPSGAGESISFGYGALGAVSLIVEVSVTQNQPVFVEDLATMLQEEVAIFWHGLEVLERLGGWLVPDPDTGRLTNQGWGPARNVTFLAADGTQLASIEEVAPGASVTFAAGTTEVGWERRIQGETAKPLARMILDTADLPLVPAEAGNPVPGPGAPLLLLTLLGAALLVGRRLCRA